ncbi:MAG: class I SAM-dependent rRNA methyltransferase [Verrucomicrobiota bacterium]
MNDIPALKLKPSGRHRILRGHPWVFGNEVEEVPECKSDLAHLYTSKGTLLGTGVYNPKSQIVFRRISRQMTDLNEKFISDKIDQAIQYRKTLPLLSESRRIIWSESDGLPGLIIDLFPPYVVVQTLTKAMSNREELICRILQDRFLPKGILLRNDAQVRALEGLTQFKKPFSSNESFQTEVVFGGVRFPVDLMQGHKTGFYLDQIENYTEIAKIAANRRVLDIFSYQGGFSLSALKAGAKSCLAIDQDASALERAKAAASLNGLKLDTEHGNAFDLLRKYEQEGRTFDLVILDPPSFTKNKANIESAMRGYHDLHLRAVKLLSPGGLLATFCCSHNIAASEWEEMVSFAASDVNTLLRFRKSFRQNPDHPMILQIPETSYLFGSLYEKVS